MQFFMLPFFKSLVQLQDWLNMIKQGLYLIHEYQEKSYEYYYKAGSMKSITEKWLWYLKSYERYLKKTS